MYKPDTVGIVKKIIIGTTLVATIGGSVVFGTIFGPRLFTSNKTQDNTVAVSTAAYDSVEKDWLNHFYNHINCKNGHAENESLQADYEFIEPLGTKTSQGDAAAARLLAHMNECEECNPVVQNTVTGPSDPTDPTDPSTPSKPQNQEEEEEEEDDDKKVVTQEKEDPEKKPDNTDKKPDNTDKKEDDVVVEDPTDTTDPTKKDQLVILEEFEDLEK